MKMRWVIYALIGFLFGIFDFFYQEWVQSLAGSSLLMIVLILAIWLVPVVPAALYETRLSGSRWKAALASVVTWSAAIISYYLYMAVEIAFFSLSTRPEMHVSNSADPFFWSNWASVLRYDILGGMLEWIAVAVVGGFIVGWGVSLAAGRRLAADGRG